MTHGMKHFLKYSSSTSLMIWILRWLVSLILLAGYNIDCVEREFPSPSERSSRGSSRSEVPPENLYPPSWAIDKTAVRASVKSFREEFLELYICPQRYP